MAVEEWLGITEDTIKIADENDDELTARLNAVLERNYQKLGKDMLKVYNRLEDADPKYIQVELSKLKQNKIALQILSPQDYDRYEKEFDKLMQQQSALGITYGDLMTEALTNPPELVEQFGQININTAAIALNSTSRLKNQTQEAAKDVKGFVADNLLRGGTEFQLAKDIQGRLGTSKAQAATIARTESTNVLNESARQRYEQYGATHVQLIAMVDERTTPWCRYRHMKIIKITDSMPSYHYNCRTMISTVDPAWISADDLKWMQQQRVEAQATGLSLSGKAPFDKKKPVFRTADSFVKSQPKAKKKKPKPEKGTTAFAPVTKEQEKEIREKIVELQGERRKIKTGSAEWIKATNEIHELKRSIRKRESEVTKEQEQEIREKIVELQGERKKIKIGSAEWIKITNEINKFKKSIRKREPEATTEERRAKAIAQQPKEEGRKVRKGLPETLDLSQGFDNLPQLENLSVEQVEEIGKAFVKDILKGKKPSIARMQEVKQALKDKGAKIAKKNGVTVDNLIDLDPTVLGQGIKKVKPKDIPEIKKEVENFIALTGGYGQRSEGKITIGVDGYRGYHRELRQNKNLGLRGFVNIGEVLDETILHQTLLHELGHNFENQSNDFFGTKQGIYTQRSYEFVRSKSKSDKEESINKLLGVNYFDDNEKAYDGDFSHPYVGKVYRNDRNNIEATEVFSMAIQEFAEESPPRILARRYREHPDHFNYAIGLLLVNQSEQEQ